MDFSFLPGIFASPWDILRNIIDIAIIAYVFYRLLRLIKGSRAEQLLKGLVILLVFSVVASLMQLEMVTWLLEKAWIVFAITLPIVFQPELRRLLEQLGKGTFFASSLNQESQRDGWEMLAREISDAAAVLSRNRVGALIVLQRHNDIEEYLESGVKLDAQVSSRLLINIFVPNTPLHDGAVVISKGRIDRAAAFLPLSTNPLLDKELGTRHRAGIGISEVSDAIVVIISEETGTISTAVGGKLNRYLDTAALKEWLTREIVHPERESSSWWRRRWDDNGNRAEQTGDHRS